jgi:hypothetical protein
MDARAAAYTDVFTAVPQTEFLPKPGQPKNLTFALDGVLHPPPHIGIVRVPLSGCSVALVS